MTPLRDVVALPAFYLVSRAPLLAEVAVGVGFLLLLSERGMPPAHGVVVLAVALLGAFAVRLATTAPTLRTTNGGRRTVQDACWEAADRVATWAGWEFTEAADDGSHD